MHPLHIVSKAFGNLKVIQGSKIFCDLLCLTSWMMLQIILTGSLTVVNRHLFSKISTTVDDFSFHAAYWATQEWLKTRTLLGDVANRNEETIVYYAKFGLAKLLLLLPVIYGSHFWPANAFTENCWSHCYGQLWGWKLGTVWTQASLG